MTGRTVARVERPIRLTVVRRAKDFMGSSSVRVI
jgi:hypothetical protein